MAILKRPVNNAAKGFIIFLYRWHNHLDPNIIKKSWTMA